MTYVSADQLSTHVYWQLFVGPLKDTQRQMFSMTLYKSIVMHYDKQ